jgi:hypothetical protein
MGTSHSTFLMVSWQVAMKLVAEYRKFAEEYRKLSDKSAKPTDKEALKLMARAWERVAAVREDRVLDRIVKGLLDRACREKVHRVDGEVMWTKQIETDRADNALH